MPSNDLYLAVLPLVHLGRDYGFTEQTLTLFPDKNFATVFDPKEVDGYIAAFKSRTELLTGGRVTGYDWFKESTDDGMVIVRVVQNVR